MHILGLIVSQDPNGPAAHRNIDVAKLEEVTREAMATWFADREKPKNAEKRCFLTQLFRVLYKEERYRRGELDGSTTICINDLAGSGDYDDEDDEEDEPPAQQYHQTNPISPFLPTPSSSLSPSHPITSTASTEMVDYYPPRVPLRSSYVPNTPDVTTAEDYADHSYPMQQHGPLTHNQQPPSYPTRAWPTQEINIYTGPSWPTPPPGASGPIQQYYPGIPNTTSSQQQQGQGVVFLPPPVGQTYEDVNGRGNFDGNQVRGFGGNEDGGWEIL